MGEAHKLDGRWQLEIKCAIHMLLLSGKIYNKCNSRISQHSWCPSSQTPKQWKHHCSFVTKTYGTDQEECVSVLNHSDKHNEFPRSTEWVFVLFWERAWIPEQISTAVIGLKMERQLWNEGRGGLLSMHLPVGETNANHLLSYWLAIQYLAEKELVSDAGVCYSRQLCWQSDCFLFLLLSTRPSTTPCKDKSYSRFEFILTTPSMSFKYRSLIPQCH